MGIARRSFLQQVSQLLVLLAAGSMGGHACAPAAQAGGASRKLALLVGIDHYGSGAFLRGSVADVDRQRELLISRFGFLPQDIVTLTNGEATRDRIETVFLEHLVAQAAGDDCVFMHFSGYGRQALLAGERQESLLAATNGRDGSDGLLPLSTLCLLARSLATSRIALVLDTSFSGSDRPLLGNLRSRTFPDGRSEAASGAELAFRDRQQERILPGQGPNFLEERLLRASEPGCPATEGDWGGFQGGLFTHALVRALWQAVPARQIWFDLALANQQIAAWTGGQQQTQFPAADSGIASVVGGNGYFASAPASGLVVATDRDGTVAVRLVGLPLSVLRGYATNSRLAIASRVPGGAATQLQVYAREGLTARSRLVAGEMPQIGQVATEAIRVLPYNPGLSLAFDASFDRIERVDATSAFANVAAVTAQSTAGDGVTDCVFGRSPGGGYSLQWPNGRAIPTTIGPNNEAIKSAVGRLSEYLNTLLAAKLWRMLANGNASGLRASVKLETSYPTAQLMQWQATAGVPLEPTASDRNRSRSLARATVGDEIQYRLENRGDRPLYFAVLGLDAAGNAIAFFPSFPNEPQIVAGGTRILPEPAASYDWIVGGPAGVAEVFVFLSSSPLRGTWEAIANSAGPRSDGERVVGLSSPLSVTYALQEDLRAASAVGGDLFGYDPAVYALDVERWAALDFIYRVDA